MQDNVKKKAPVQATGGGGFRYENAVAAQFLLDLIGGTNALGVDFGRVARIDWQARDAGWLADDLIITCKASGGDRTAALSIKSAQQVTRAGFPQDFVTIAWAQWFAVKTDRKLRDGNDAVGLITRSLAHEVKDAWSSLLHDALLTQPDRIAAVVAGAGRWLSVFRSPTCVVREFRVPRGASKQRRYRQRRDCRADASRPAVSL